MGLLDGKVAVVTGAGGGLGKAESLLFASEGAKVVVNDLGGKTDGTGASASPADIVVAEIKRMGGEAVANYDSVATWEGGERIIKTAIDTFCRIDILVNNAGIARNRMIFNMTEEEWDIVQRVHLYGHFYCTRHACAYFRQQRSGRIINTASQTGLGNMGQANLGLTNYSAAKEGVVGFTRTVALDMAKYGVTCNCIRPMAATRMTVSPDLQAALEKASQKDSGDTATGLEAEIKRMSPAHIASLVVYLATDAAANINGKSFLVGGGEIGLYSEPEIASSIFKDGIWTVQELVDIMPRSVTKGLPASV
ncbi:MAG: SDR family NAD(P)-dependent oxidoreductase [Dehalococcoidia bacterium]|nr:SDR family NAD(P)-dependent oxidoreductase [Dehalococcoidia bacterium]